MSVAAQCVRHSCVTTYLHFFPLGEAARVCVRRILKVGIRRPRSTGDRTYPYCSFEFIYIAIYMIVLLALQDCLD